MENLEREQEEIHLMKIVELKRVVSDLTPYLSVADLGEETKQLIEKNVQKACKKLNTYLGKM